MTMTRRFLALVLTLCLMLPLCSAAFADTVTPLIAGVFKDGAYGSEGEGTVYFTVAGAEAASLYSVPSAGGEIALIETQDRLD